MRAYVAPYVLYVENGGRCINTHTQPHTHIHTYACARAYVASSPQPAPAFCVHAHFVYGRHNWAVDSLRVWPSCGLGAHDDNGNVHSAHTCPHVLCKHTALLMAVMVQLHSVSPAMLHDTYLLHTQHTHTHTECGHHGRCFHGNNGSAALSAPSQAPGGGGRLGKGKGEGVHILLRVCVRTCMVDLAKVLLRVCVRARACAWWGELGMLKHA